MLEYIDLAVDNDIIDKALRTWTQKYKGNYV
jgi:hypothetical protein